MRNLKYLYSIISFIPIINLGVFFSFVMRAFLKLGYLPSYNNPDPVSLGFNYHYRLIDILFYIYVPVIIIWVITSILLYIKKIKTNRITFYLCLLSISIFIFAFFFDPKNILEWFMD
jgi:hypothetical protein